MPYIAGVPAGRLGRLGGIPLLDELLIECRILNEAEILSVADFVAVIAFWPRVRLIAGLVAAPVVPAFRTFRPLFELGLGRLALFDDSLLTEQLGYKRFERSVGRAGVVLDEVIVIDEVVVCE